MNVSFVSSRRRHTRYWRDWSSDVCSSDLVLDRRGSRRGAGCREGRGAHRDHLHLVAGAHGLQRISDRKSTRLNSSHANISYAVFCLKKKKKSSTSVCG